MKEMRLVRFSIDFYKTLILLMFNWRYYHIKNILFYHLFFFIWVGIWRNKQMAHPILSGTYLPLVSKFGPFSVLLFY